MIPKTILFCTDFSANSEPARETALDFAKNFGAALVVLHVMNPSRLGYPSLEDLPLFDVSVKTVEESLQKSLDAMAAECRKVVPDVTAQLRKGVPASEIVSAGNERNVDLIVTGTHGWSGVSQLLLGSTAENVVRTARRPVLTVWTCQPYCK